jgi:hypothetical protein
MEASVPIGTDSLSRAAVKIGPLAAARAEFEIQPILSAALPEVAAFLHWWRGNYAGGAAVLNGRKPVPESSLSIERRLRWLLTENPVAAEGSPLGYCIRDRSGVIRGTNLCFPSAFLAGDQRLLGLCSGSFFVEPCVQSMGFYLFRKYLSSPGYSFFFATTCNENSEPLWRMLGGQAVPHSETEYILPLRLDVMIPALVAARTSSGIASGMARIAGRGANPVLRFLTRRPAALSIEPCRDWERLSALFRRHRPANYITSDRSPKFLQWRYGPASPLYSCGTHLVRDRFGNEGWFCLGHLNRGGVRGAFLLDAVWPRAKMSFREMFREILRVASADVDVFIFRRRPGLEYREYCRWAIPHGLGARTFVISPKGAPALAPDALDPDDNDYVAWMFPTTARDSVPGNYGV